MLRPKDTMSIPPAAKESRLPSAGTQGRLILNLRTAFARSPLGVIATVILFILLAILSLRIVVGAATSAAMFSFPFQFDESEGMIVAETMLLDQGVNIFEVPTAQFFVAAPYPPLFYLVNWPIQRLAGDEPTFKGGRAISLVATLLAAAFIFGIIIRFYGDKLAGAIGAGVWLSLGLTNYWGILVKPDMLAVSLGLGGLWVLVVRGPDRPWLALLFFLCAFFTKQTAIAAGAASCIWLIYERPRKGIAFAAVYVLGALISSLILDFTTKGGYFYHLLTLHDLPWFADRFQQYVSYFLSTYGLFVVPSAIGLLWAGASSVLKRLLSRERTDVERHSPLFVLYLAISIFSAIGTGTLGGNHNHLLEWAASTSLGLGLLIALLRARQSRRIQVAASALGLLLLLQTPSLFATPAWLQRELSLLSDTKREGMQNIFQYVTNNGGTAYSDNVGLLLITGKKLWSTDPFTQTHATFYGRWDDSELVKAIEKGEFAQIILRIDVFDPKEGAGDVSPRILQAVRNHYKLDKRNVENIYVPR